MPLHNYIKDINKRYVTGIAREHAYRPSLQTLIESVIPKILATNDPARIECGAPDFILLRGDIPVGYIEAKDIGDNLDKTEKSEQIKRYLGLDNLLLTDYLEFRFYRNGEKVEQIRIAEVTPSGQIKPLPDHFDKLVTLLVDFAAFSGQTITSAKKLAEMMARKARLMRDVFYKVVQSKQNSLHDQFKAFKTVLVHDMDEKQFADVYAQTVAYGLFTARLHDKTLEDFSRHEALPLIPKSNPFLRQLFHYITGPDLDGRAVWIVNALREVYRAADLRAILKDFGSATGQNDPILHFYETFLGEYDKKLKKARGVWYTPEPVVNFIVRAIDDVLKNHFGLKEGLADTSKVKIQVEAQETDKRTKSRRKMFEREVHKVQLLDVAAGTGTFLAEAVKQIYRRLKGQEGLWSGYVERDLIPRLHGFELLMASYAMCHMKLDLLLQETGYKPSNPQNPPRLSVYLTNSLEEHHPDMDTLFAKWLSDEANEASQIKKETPIMVAFGNPPYSGHSSNKGKWLEDILNVYKKEPGGKVKLQEKNSKWLNDDYVKFIRLGEYYIDKNGEGILAYITNHGYLDNPTFRGMRWRLLNTFDDIYILDLHGNSKKKEVAPDGKPDKNVFDIQQGVAIIIAIKKSHKGKKKPLATMHHADLWGDRYKKYDFLNGNTLSSTNFTKLKPMGKNYFFIPKDHKLMGEYEKGFAVNELFPINSVGIVTARDALTIHEKREDLVNAIERFSALPVEEARQEYNLSKDVQDWKVSWAQDDLKKTGLNPENIQPINYRPFDTRWTYYTGRSRGFHCRPRGDVMRHFLEEDNVGLILSKRVEIGKFSHVFLSSQMIQHHTMSLKEVNVSFPLWIYDEGLEGINHKRHNLNETIYAQIRETVQDLTPENLFDYIYAVLHSPEYRRRYAEFLKSDFPRIPYPKDAKTFYALIEYGKQLRELHLMESNRLNDLTTTYPVDGDHEVTKPSYKDGKVWINHKQYFGDVQEVAWEFFIGGYQPAQKWLKDRKGRKLTIDDIRHWQRMIVALTETDRIMQRIDVIDFLPKGKK